MRVVDVSLLLDVYWLQDCTFLHVVSTFVDLGSLLTLLGKITLSSGLANPCPPASGPCGVCHVKCEWDFLIFSIETLCPLIFVLVSQNSRYPLSLVDFPCLLTAHVHYQFPRHYV